MGAVSSPPYFSVIIAGAGPTGLTAANLLGMLGIDALVLERNSGLSDCPKAIAIDDEGLRICQAMGLSKAVIENVLLGIDAHYISGKHYLGRAAPTSMRNGYPLISTFDQPEFEATLLRDSSVSQASACSFNTRSKHLSRVMLAYLSLYALPVEF